MKNKIKNILSERRLPWFLAIRIKEAQNTFYFLLNRAMNLFCASFNKGTPLISFYCGFHGNSGGTFAIANIANILATKYQVEFVTYPSSNFNRLLNSNIKLVRNPNFSSSVFVSDAESDHGFFEKLKLLDKRLIITCHCFPYESHGLEPKHIIKSLSYADKVHFVSSSQQEAFQLEPKKYEIIPNTTKKINKKTTTNCVGCVGNLNNIQKNVDESVEIALASKAEAIHLWSIKKDVWHNKKVIVHDWESDKEKIYNSFDALVFMSQLETFGLVVIEAMSAGIPCLLSSIPAFEQFRGCPGVKIISSNSHDNAAELLNELLVNKNILGEQMKIYFDKTYSEAAIFQQWDNLILKTLHVD